jgi:hypothetical protein
VRFEKLGDTLHPADHEAVEWLTNAAEGDAVSLIARPRSLSQNDLINAMYGDIAAHTEGEGIVDIRRRCKLHYGVPILRAHDAEFREIYDRVIKQHTYDDKLAMMDYLPVTSRMSKSQATEYIDTVQREYAEKGVRFSEQAA